MASKVQICNLALTRIAASRISDFSDNTVEAKDCKAIYDLIAEDVMSMGDWPSTRRRATLAQLSTAPAFEYTYAYQLPTNPRCLRVISINECKPGEIDYTIENDQLLTNETSVSIKYSAFVDDPNKYDVYLRQAIVDRLAAELIYGKTGQSSAFKSALDFAENRVMKLLAEASPAGTSKEVNSDTFIDVRNGIWPTGTNGSG